MTRRSRNRATDVGSKPRGQSASARTEVGECRGPFELVQPDSLEGIEVPQGPDEVCSAAGGILTTKKRTAQRQSCLEEARSINMLYNHARQAT